MSIDVKAELRAITRAVLNDESQRAVEAFLQKEEIGQAKMYILGGLESCFAKRSITVQEMVAFCRRLNLSPEVVSQVHQRCVMLEARSGTIN